jgi:hypothetical protein
VRWPDSQREIALGAAPMASLNSERLSPAVRRIRRAAPVRASSRAVAILANSAGVIGPNGTHLGTLGQLFPIDVNPGSGKSAPRLDGTFPKAYHSELCSLRHNYQGPAGATGRSIYCSLSQITVTDVSSALL